MIEQHVCTVTIYWVERNLVLHFVKVHDVQNCGSVNTLMTWCWNFDMGYSFHRSLSAVHQIIHIEYWEPFYKCKMQMLFNRSRWFTYKSLLEWSDVEGLWAKPIFGHDNLHAVTGKGREIAIVHLENVILLFSTPVIISSFLLHLTRGFSYQKLRNEKYKMIDGENFGYSDSRITSPQKSHKITENAKLKTEYM